MISTALIALVTAANVTVEVGANRHPISPGIYGVSFGSEAQVRRMGVSLRHFGGNAYSRYNFTGNTTNEGGDGRWFRNLNVDGGIDAFMAISRSAGTEMVVELPVLGWVAKPNAPESAPLQCGVSVAKYGAQQTTAPNDADCGDGKLPDGGWVTGIDPNDTSVPIDAGFVRSYADHLTDGGVQYFQLGNQPALWSITHQDVHPQASSYLEIRARFAEAASVAKAANPQARTLGPSEWGWLNYFDSYAGDRMTSGIDFVPFYLREARLLGLVTGVRPLDYLDLHVYPNAMAPDVSIISRGDTSPAVSALRLRSTRILWDPTYAVESWESCCFDTVLRVLPRMREWIAAGYPGTGMAISAYAWGALDHISGALAQADVLGIFGREGVAIAALDGLPADGALGEDAFKLYRSFDGAGAKFGTTSVRTVSDDEMVSAFASVEGDRVLVVLINKDSVQSQPADVALSALSQLPSSGTYRAFAFNAAQRLGPSGTGSFTGGHLVRVLPPWSAEIVELSPAGWDGGYEYVDAGSPPVPDAGQPVEDGGVQPDGGMLDAGTIDASMMPVDAGMMTMDAGTRPDGGTSPADAGGEGGNGSCGCSAGASPLLFGLVLLLRRRRAAKRAQ